MTDQQIAIARKLTDRSANHEEWVEIVLFGLPSLLTDVSLLAEILFRETVRQNELAKGTDRTVLSEILTELKLTLVSESLEPKERRAAFEAARRSYLESTLPGPGRD